MKAKIEAVLDRVRPALQYHDGDIELVRYDPKSKTVYIHFQGTCTHCAISEITLTNLIERELKKSIPTIQAIVPV